MAGDAPIWGCGGHRWTLHIFLLHFPLNLYLMIAVTFADTMLVKDTHARHQVATTFAINVPKAATYNYNLISSGAADRCFRTPQKNKIKGRTESLTLK